jgi:hypothetical protein
MIHSLSFSFLFLLTADGMYFVDACQYVYYFPGNSLELKAT